MARIIVVTSGKGGVGKTTSSASFSTGLAQRGHKTVVIDFDVGLRNLDLIMENRQAAVAQAEAIIETRVQSFMPCGSLSRRATTQRPSMRSPLRPVCRT